MVGRGKYSRIVGGDAGGTAHLYRICKIRTVWKIRTVRIFFVPHEMGEDNNPDVKDTGTVLRGRTKTRF